MTTFLLPYPVIDPTLVQIGGLSIRWYGLMYVLAFVIGGAIMAYLVRRYRRIGLSDAQRGDFLVWATFGVVLGGRIGYMLFYNLPYYLAHPMKVFAVWEGGMSFHGGALGLIIAMGLFARKRKLPFLALTDLVVVPTSLGLAFGRIGNFINAELRGRPSDAPWAMLFPNDLTPRHPVQLYAVGKDLLLFWALWEIYRRSNRPGVTAASFLVLYGVLRFGVEFFREPDVQIGYIGPFTLGQLLTIPLVIVGGFLLWKFQRSTVDGSARNKGNTRSDAHK